MYGALEIPSAYYMKHPPRQMSDSEAKERLLEMVKKF